MAGKLLKTFVDKGTEGLYDSVVGEVSQTIAYESYFSNAHTGGGSRVCGVREANGVPRVRHHLHQILLAVGFFSNLVLYR